MLPAGIRPISAGRKELECRLRTQRRGPCGPWTTVSGANRRTPGPAAWTRRSYSSPSTALPARPMDQIAKRAGASTKTLYSRFDNKSEILEAVVRAQRAAHGGRSSARLCAAAGRIRSARFSDQVRDADRHGQSGARDRGHRARELRRSAPLSGFRRDVPRGHRAAASTPSAGRCGSGARPASSISTKIRTTSASSPSGC